MVPSWGGIYLDNVKVFHQIKAHEAYQALPRKVSNQVLIQLHKAWVAFFEAMEAWKKHPEQFIGRPKLPGYKHKTAGRNLLVYEKDAIWKRELDRGVIAVSGLGELIQTKQTRKTVNKADFIPRLVNGRPVMTPVGCSLGLLGVEPHACEIGMRMVEPAPFGSGLTVSRLLYISSCLRRRKVETHRSETICAGCAGSRTS